MAAIFQTTFSNAFSWMKIYKFWFKISLKFVPKGPINNIPALVQIMVWRRLGGKPLSEPMMVILLTHICVTRPQWVNTMSKMLPKLQPIVSHFVLIKVLIVNQALPRTFCIGVYQIPTLGNECFTFNTYYWFQIRLCICDTHFVGALNIYAIYNNQ